MTTEDVAGHCVIEVLYHFACIRTVAAGSAFHLAGAHEPFPSANCRCVGGNAIVGGMRPATGGADDPGGPGAD